MKKNKLEDIPKFLIKEGDVFKTITIDEVNKIPLSSVPIRYIRDWLDGSSANTGNHWIEIEIKKENGENVARELTAKTNDGDEVTGANFITDGDSSSSNYGSVPVGLKYIELELKEKSLIKDIKIWHYFNDKRTYHKTKTEVSTDGLEWVTIFDSAESGEYAESSDGKTHDLSLIEVPSYSLEEVTGIIEEPTPEQFAENGFEKKYLTHILNLYKTPKNIQLMCYSKTSLSPVIKLKGLKKNGELIKMNYDINMTAENILSIKDSFLEFVKTDTNGILRVIFSFDSGATWKSLNESTVVDINISDHSDIENNGLSEIMFHDLTIEQLSLLFLEKKIRYAVYIKSSDAFLDNKISKLKVLYNKQ